VASAAAVAAVSAAATIPGAIGNSFWEDEVASAHVLIQPTPWDMLHQVARTEATPPLWYALGWLASQLGLSPATYRGLSVLAAALVAGGTVLLARRLLPLWASVLAGLVVALGWQFMLHGSELRAYELFALSAVVFALVLLDERQGPRRRGWRRYLLAGTVACGSLTNYFFLLTVIGALLWLWREWVEARPGGQTPGWLARQIGIGLIPLFIWSPVAVHQYVGQHFSWIGPFTVRRLLAIYWELFVRQAYGTTPVLVSVLALGAVLLGCALLIRRPGEGRLVALLAVVPVALSGLVWLAGAHVFDPRNLIGAGPFAAVAVAALVAALPLRLGYAVAVALTAALTVGVMQDERTPPTPYNTVSQILVREGWRSRDPIVIVGNLGDFFAFRSPLEWYLPRQPALTLGELHGPATCPTIFALARTQTRRTAVVRSGLVAASARAGPVLVARLSTFRVPASGLWRRARILATRQIPASCVRLVAESRIIAALRR
jgi:hypothetical protein